MAVDKLVDSAQLESGLTDIADAIRAKTGGTADLQFPGEFVSEIGSISGGGGVSWDDIATGVVPTGDIILTCSSIASYGMALQSGSAWTLYSRTVTSIAQYGCRNADKLTKAFFPNLTTLGGQSFYYDSKLTTLDIGSANIKVNEFNGCTVLGILILRKTTGIQTLANVNAFFGTKFKSGGAGGTIYIPKALYDELGTGSSLDYKAATNWSTIDGYGTITWAQIEGSEYEL